MTDRPSRDLPRWAGMWLFAFAVTAAFVVNRTIADAIFLSRIGIESLPLMLLISALVVGLISVYWSRLTARLSFSNVLIVTHAGLIACSTVLNFLLTTFPDSIAVVGGLYLLAEIRGCLSTILIALLLNDGARRDSTKSHFAYINAAAPTAGITVGFLLGYEAEAVSSQTLFWSCCLCDLVAIAAARINQRFRRSRGRIWKLDSHRPIGANLRSNELVGNAATIKLAKLVTWIVVCKVVVLSVVAYEWKVIARATWPNEQHLVAYFAIFYAATDALTLFTQLFVARHFLTRRRLAICLVSLPALLGFAGIATLCFESTTILLILLSVARGGIVIRRGLHDIAIQVLYGWMPQPVRRRMVTRVLGIAKPLAEAGGALGIILLAHHLDTHRFAWVWLAVLLIWGWGLAELMRQLEKFESDAHLSTERHYRLAANRKRVEEGAE